MCFVRGSKDDGFAAMCEVSRHRAAEVADTDD
jgi:hypothetical protein